MGSKVTLLPIFFEVKYFAALKPETIVSIPRDKVEWKKGCRPQGWGSSAIIL
jgi:hypothetical protein